LNSAGSLTDWQITSNGIDKLDPEKLTITDRTKLLILTAAVLSVPPYPIIHGFLLYWLWMYVLPRERAKRYAIFTTLGLTLLGAIVIIIWLTDMYTDFYPVVGITSFIIVLTDVILTLWFANGKVDIPKKRWLAVGAVVVSSIVPAGVASLGMGWWLVYLVVFGYWFFRGTFGNAIQPKTDDWRMRWLVDRLTIEVTIVGVVVLVLLAIAILNMKVTEPGLVLVVVTFISMMLLLPPYAKDRLRQVYQTKGMALPQQTLMIRGDIFTWMASSAIAAIGTLMIQFIVYFIIGMIWP
jgi:hypothetical protein